MYESLLTKIGFTTEEAAVYEALVTHGRMTAGDLLRLVKIKRGSLYNVLARLSERSLVSQKTREGKSYFIPESPEKINDLFEEQVSDLQRDHESLKKSIPELQAKYILANERPVIRFFEGKDGLQRMYEDRLGTDAKEQYLVRTAQANAYRDMFGKWFTYFLNKRTELGMKTHAITPDDHTASSHDPAADKKRNVTRTWVRMEDYSAPIELSVYGNKVSIISYGKEVFGILIENGPLAQAIKDLFKLAEKGAKTIQVNHDHPLIKDM